MVRTFLLAAASAAAASSAHAGIAGGSGTIHVLHYTGDPVPAEPRMGFDLIEPPPGSTVHLSWGTHLPFVVWDPWPATFSLDSQADLLNDQNLVIGSTSVAGGFAYDWEPGGTAHLVGWPGRIRLTQTNTQLQVADPSVLRVDFSVTFDLDAAGIPMGGIPLEIDFRIAGSASAAAFDYSVTWQTVFNSFDVEPKTLAGGMALAGDLSHHEQNPHPLFDPPVIFAPDGLDPQAVIIVSGFFQAHVKNDDAPAEMILDNNIFVPEPATCQLALLAALITTDRRRRSHPPAASPAVP